MKGICFKEDMFKLVISGEKTQTRRIIKDIPAGWDLIGKGITQLTAFIKPGTGEMLNVYPRYSPREIVYLKEPYHRIFKNNGRFPDFKDNVVLYKFDDYWPNSEIRWNNKLFMPEKYARYFILINKVRVEKLCDISGPDAIAEGFGEKSGIKKFFKYGVYGKARLAFWKKWDKIHGTESSFEIPWVWVYEFELIKSHEAFTSPAENKADDIANHIYRDAQKLLLK